MASYRVMRYAQSQARVRARLGAMPNSEQWQHLAQAGDLNHMIDRMRSNGLGFWLSGLPREPDHFAIETHLYQRAQQLIDNLCHLLPSDCQGIKRWLRLAPDLPLLTALLHQQSPSLPADLDGPLQQMAVLSLDQRHTALQTTAYGPLIAATESPTSLWLTEFRRRLPKLSGIEVLVLRRINRVIGEHVDQVQDLRRQYRQSIASSPDIPQHETQQQAQWQLRDQLAIKLRALFAGDPFHVGTILLYGLLEAIQYERLRGMLLWSAHGWQEEEPFKAPI